MVYQEKGSNMGKNGGVRPGAGRPKGSKSLVSKVSKAETERIITELVAEDKMTPLEYMLDVMLEPLTDEIKASPLAYTRWRANKLEAAKVSAPYCHPKLSSVDHTGSIAEGNEAALEQLEALAAEEDKAEGNDA